MPLHSKEDVPLYTRNEQLDHLFDDLYAENRFQRDSEMLGEEGAALWARFDKEMDRLHETQFSADARAAGSTG